MLEERFMSHDNSNEPFFPENTTIPFDIIELPADEAVGNTHSYFEDGDDPDEQLKLPQSIVEIVSNLNTIQHSGCIIFEALESNLKIHNFFSSLTSHSNTLSLAYYSN